MAKCIDFNLKCYLIITKVSGSSCNLFIYFFKLQEAEKLKSYKVINIYFLFNDLLYMILFLYFLFLLRQKLSGNR